MMEKIYATVTDGMSEFNEKNAQERFVAWCLPGIPIDLSELRFAHRGFVGQGATPEEQAADTALAGQARQFAHLSTSGP
ncbi:MAG: hypothetical protein R3B70_40975 [Polyangiaceae bacterium]